MGLVARQGAQHREPGEVEHLLRLGARAPAVAQQHDRAELLAVAPDRRLGGVVDRCGGGAVLHVAPDGRQAAVVGVRRADGQVERGERDDHGGVERAGREPRHGRDGALAVDEGRSGERGHGGRLISQ